MRPIHLKYIFPIVFSSKLETNTSIKLDIGKKLSVRKSDSSLIIQRHYLNVGIVMTMNLNRI